MKVGPSSNMLYRIRETKPDPCVRVANCVHVPGLRSADAVCTITKPWRTEWQGAFIQLQPTELKYEVSTPVATTPRAINPLVCKFQFGAFVPETIVISYWGWWLRKFCTSKLGWFPRLWEPTLPGREYEGVSKSFRTESLTKYTLATINTRWEATRMVIGANLTRLTHKVAIQLHLVAESCTICSSRSRRLVRKLLDTLSYVTNRKLILPYCALVVFSGIHNALLLLHWPQAHVINTCTFVSHEDCSFADVEIPNDILE
jgi:hypothetical protein